MKSVIVTDGVDKEIGFPRLMRYKDGGIILCTGKNTDQGTFSGTCVFPGPGCLLAETGDDWRDTGLYVFTGKIELSNN
jgi:hypothetical protein